MNNRKLSKKNFIYISIMIFGLFFGSGNLIFPPFLGKNSGSNFLIALLFFSITGIIFPLLAIIGVSKFEGINNLTNMVNNKFTLLYTIAIYLTIGPGLAIPRNGSLPFEISIVPYLKNTDNIILYRLIFTIIFFSIIYYLSLNPKKIVFRLGKILTPILILLIVIIFVSILSRPVNALEPSIEYINNPAIKGFLEGYNTMDALAGLNFGIVITLAIKNFGITSQKTIEKTTLKAGVVASMLLFTIYFMLTYVGYATSNMFPKTKNGADILVLVVRNIYGIYGNILLAVIFTIACLSVCIGLITSISQYFSETYKFISYKKWATIYTIISFILANFGLNKILLISIPILLSIYPVSLSLIILALFSKYFNNSKIVFKITVYTNLIFSISMVINKYIGNRLDIIFNYLPLNNFNLGWTFPTLVAFIISFIFVKTVKNRI